MKRRSKIFGVFMILFMLVLAGCQKGGSSTQTGSEKTGEKEVTIKLFSAHGQFRNGQYGYDRIQEFMKKHPNIKVEVTYAHGKNWDDTFLHWHHLTSFPILFSQRAIF